MSVRENLLVLEAGFPNPGGGTLTLRTRLFKPIDHATCLVYAKGQETWLDLNIRPNISTSSVDEVWWLAKSP